MKLLVILIELAFASFLPCFLAQEEFPIKETSGILFEEVNPLPIFHEKVASLVYQFKTPVWTSLWSPPYNGTFCVDDLYNGTAPFYHCPVDFHHNLIERHIFPSIDIEALKVKSAIPNNIRTKCNLINNKGLRAQYLDDFGVSEYLSAIRNCSSGYFMDSGINEDYIKFDIPGRHRALRDKYKAEYSAKLVSTAEDRHKQSSYVMNTRVTNDIIMFHYHVESLRWKNAQSACSSGLLPSTLLTPGMLNASLTELKSLIAADFHSLALDEKYLSTYYTLPFAECAFNADSFLVHVQVPIVKANDPWSLVTATQVPLYDPVNDSICLVPINNPTYLYQPTTSTAFEADGCGEICAIPEATQRPLEKTCGTVTLLNEEEYVQELCGLECKPKIRYQLPIFRKVGSDIFTVTGNPGDQFVIQCDNKIAGEPKSVQVVPLPAEGAVEVVLGCECKILYDELEIPAQWPCGSDAIVSYLTYAFKKNSNDNSFDLLDSAELY